MSDPGPTSVVPGRLLDGRYRIERLLGSGATASVWRARDLRLDRQVAIKELSGDGLRQPGALERFAREARTVGGLSHSNVVSVHDVGIQDAQAYLVMEFVDGPTVAMLLAEGPLPVADVLAIGSQVCDGLAAAHRAGIIHRDIKPANLIVTAAGVVKICDFGIARLLDLTTSADLDGPTGWGSPGYMAPEQIYAGPVDPRTDLYALGCTLYAMLTGAPPFTSGGVLDIVHQRLTQPPEPLRRHRPEVPPQVAALVADLLSKEPDDRPTDAATVGRRISAALADPALAAAPRGLAMRAIAVPFAVATVGATPDDDRPHAGPDTRTRRTTRRRLAAIAAVLIAVAVGTAVALTLPSTPRSPATTLTGPTASAATSPTPSVPASPKAHPAPTGSEKPQVTVTPTRAATSPPPPPTPASPAPPADPIVGLRQAIAQQAATGALQPDQAPALNHMVDDLVHSIATGKPGDVRNKITAIRTKLATLVNEGKLSAAGYVVLSNAVNLVAAANSV